MALAGLVLGLALLTRTMVIGLVPIVVVAAAIWAYADCLSIRESFRRTVFFVVPAAVVASTWWATSAGEALGYLSGRSAKEPFTLGLINVEAQLVATSVGFGLALTLVGVTVIGIGSLLGQRQPIPPGVWFVGAVTLGVSITLVFVREENAGFQLLAAATLVPLAIGVVARSWRKFFWLPILVLAIGNAPLLVDGRSSRPWDVALGYRYEVTRSGGAPAEFDRWEKATKELDEIVAELDTTGVEPVAVPTRDVFLSADQLNLYRARSGRWSTYSNDESFVAAGASGESRAKIAITSDPPLGEAEPDPIRSIEAVIRNSGYVLIASVSLPEGRHARVWLWDP